MSSQFSCNTWPKNRLTMMNTEKIRRRNRIKKMTTYWDNVEFNDASSYSATAVLPPLHQKSYRSLDLKSPCAALILQRLIELLGCAIACASLMGCSTTSTAIPSTLGNNLRLNQNNRIQPSPLPTDESKPKVAVFLSTVECNALITGRPLELATYVRNSLIQNLASSRNFAVVEFNSAARYLIEVKISSFERGIEIKSDARAADLFLESSHSREKRRGILELQTMVSDPTGKLICSFSATSQTEDVTSSKKTGVLGFASVEGSYERRADAQVISEATEKIALGLWRRLVNQTEPVSDPNKQ